MPRISGKNQVTIPVSALKEAGLQTGDAVVVDVLDAGELRVRRAAVEFEDAFGVLTGAYPAGYLVHLDLEDAER